VDVTAESRFVPASLLGAGLTGGSMTVRFGKSHGGALVALLLLGSPALAQTSDRLSASVSGSTLTGTNGGGTGAVGWLHGFDPSTIITTGIEHDTLGPARWDFLSASGAWSFGPDTTRFGISGEAHEGGGTDAGARTAAGARTFNYEIEALDLSATFQHRLSATLEERRIDVETNHGNLPKAQLAYVWGPHLLTTASYASSTNGNLGTHLSGARIDLYEAPVNVLAGTAFGQGAPVIFGYINGQSVSRALVPSKELHEYYLGAEKPVPRWHSDFTLVADWLNLGGTKKATLTLNYSYSFGGGL